MKKLVISLATRNRPQMLLETVSRSLANWALPNTVMMLQIDDDDTATISALAQAAPHSWFVGPEGPRVVVNVKPREDTIAAKWNRALAMPGDVYLVAADDDPYIAPAYDQKIVEAADLFQDGIGMVYGHMANLSFSGVVAPTAKLCQKLGYIQPELFPYWFCDHWTDDLARMLGRISFCDVRTDQSKAPPTQEMREPAWWATFFDAGYLYRRKEVAKIVDADDFDEAPSSKQRIKNIAPRVEHYSRWVNQNVRQMPIQSLDPKDVRYQRVKQKAIDMLPLFFDGMPAQEVAAFTAMLDPPKTVASIPQAFPPTGPHLVAAE
jgi:hypothetical protein